MTPFPHQYSVTLSDAQLQAPPRQPIAAGPPPQFGGNEEVWSPEELLIGAVLECLWTTFVALARRDQLVVHEWSGAAEGILDRGPRGPVFTSITLSVALTVDAGEQERARRILGKAEQSCIITNALNVKVNVQATVTEIAHDLDRVC